MERSIGKGFSIEAIVFPVLDVLLNGGNLLIHIYISWYLTTGDYGILNAYFSLLFVLMIFGMSMQTYFAKRLSEDGFREIEIPSVSIVTNRMAVIVAFVMIILAIPMVTLLRGTMTQYLIILTTFLIQMRLSFYRGILQGHKSFLKLNSSFYIEMGFKLLILIPIIRFYQSVDAALISVLVGIAASYFFTKQTAEKNFLGRSNNEKPSKIVLQGMNRTEIHKHIIKGFMRVLSTQVFFYYFTAIVLILTNYYMGDASGLYAVSTRYGQIFIHIGLSIITVLIPYTSEVQSDPLVFRKKVIQLLLVYTFIGFMLLLGYSLIMPIVLRTLFDTKYQATSILLIPQAVAYFMLSIAFFMSSMEMVGGNRGYIRVLSLFSFIALSLIIGDSLLAFLITFIVFII